MKSRNGISKEFKFIIDDTIKLTFSFRHQALEEWTLEKWAYATLIDGRVKQKFLYFHTFFKIDWSQLIDGEDADRLQILRNSEFNGSKLELVPHLDIPSRLFDVVTFKSEEGDSQEINFSQTINHASSVGNKGTIMLYRTKYPQYFWDIRDPSNQQGVVSRKIQRLTG